MEDSAAYAPFAFMIVGRAAATRAMLQTAAAPAIYWCECGMAARPELTISGSGPGAALSENGLWMWVRR